MNIPVYESVDKLPTDGTVLLAIVRPPYGFASGSSVNFNKARALMFYSGTHNPVGTSGQQTQTYLTFNGPVQVLIAEGWVEIT